MSEIIAKIEEDYKSALKDKNELLISTLRLLKNAIHNLEIEKQHSLSQEEIWQAVEREIKKRQEAISEYQKAQRQDLAEKEKEELKILSAYLPPKLSEDEIKKLVSGAILKTKAKSQKDMGRVMQEVMSQVKGKADGAVVAEIVRKELGENG